MIWIIGFFILGIGLGIMLRRRKGFLRQVSIFSEVLVIGLLFVLGASIGSNQTVMDNLWSLGWEGLLLSLGAVAGSLLLAKPVERFLPEQQHEK